MRLIGMVVRFFEYLVGVLLLIIFGVLSFLVIREVLGETLFGYLFIFAFELFTLVLIGVSTFALFGKGPAAGTHGPGWGRAMLWIGVPAWALFMSHFVFGLDVHGFFNGLYERIINH